jgi:iron(III) transport system substrate-binding protein
MLRVLVFAALLGPIAALSAVSADQPASVVSSAKSEATVIWYSALDAPTLTALVDLFNAGHPGITVRPLQISSNAIPARLLTERTGGKYNADVVSCDQFAFAQLAESDVFVPFKVDAPAQYLRGAIDPKGAAVAFFTDTTVIAWNADRLKADGLRPPTSLADLARPEWKGKIGIDGTAFNWFQSVIATQKNGRDLLRKIAANGPFITSGHSATITQLVNGEFDVTPTAYGYMAEKARLAGRPVDFVNPNPLPVGLEYAAIVKNAPHPNAARVLVDWLISKPAQEFVASDRRTPTLMGVKGDEHVFSDRQPFYVLQLPDRAEYNGLVSEFKALFGIAG